MNNEPSLFFKAIVASDSMDGPPNSYPAQYKLFVVLVMLVAVHILFFVVTQSAENFPAG